MTSVDDLISREAAIKKLKYRYPGVGVDGSKERLRFLQYIADVEAIKEVPSAEPKKGKWLTSDDMYETGICSYCGYDTQEPVSYAITNFKHCPNCGAYMMEGENDEN